MNETEPSLSPVAPAKCVPGIAQSLGLCVFFYVLFGVVLYMLSRASHLPEGEIFSARQGKAAKTTRTTSNLKHLCMMLFPSKYAVR